MVAQDMDMQILINQIRGAEVQINAMIARRIAEITTVSHKADQTNRDPLVQLKQRELDFERAMEVQRKTM